MWSPIERVRASKPFCNRACGASPFAPDREIPIPKCSPRHLSHIPAEAIESSGQHDRLGSLMGHFSALSLT